MLKILLILTTVSVYSQTIIGTWANKELKVDYPDKESLVVDESNWEEKLKIKPIRTTFYPNGNYKSIYKDLNGKIVREVKGKWEIEEDSIYLIQMKPEVSIEKYGFKLNDDIIEFSATMDFDQDGNSNDKYFGSQKRVETEAFELMSGKMKQYYFVLIKKGAKRDQSQAEIQKLQMVHMANIRKMASSSKLQVAGPFPPDQNYSGIFILDVATEKEAWELLKEDPAYKAGRFDFELLPWWTESGSVIR